MITVRKCSTCKQVKPRSEFSGNEYRCKECAKELQRNLRKEHPERFNTDKRRKYNRELIKEKRKTAHTKVIEKLGGKCSNLECLVPGGCKDFRTLQIDHINGNGKSDISKFKSQYAFYLHLLEISDEELFSNYQCLCANCNWIKRYDNNELYKIKKEERILISSFS